ncbi:transposase [Enterococcus faecium]|nr:transposase [Enterococcus faecium]
MRSSKYTEHYTDTFITFKEIMRTVSNIYHNCVPDKIKNRRNTDQPVSYTHLDVYKRQLLKG